MTTEKKWVLPEETKSRVAVVERLMKETKQGFSRATLEFLYNRGVREENDIFKYTNNGPETEHSPYAMKDVSLAVKHLMKAIEVNKKIIVYGDYDCDGVCSTSIAVLALRKLGANVDYYINSRFVEGYGICPLGVDNLLKKFPDTDLILTVDNGIVAFEGIDYATKKGIEVLVTDHHLAQKNIPENAIAVVNPHRLDDSYPFEDICGATVIYKTMFALYWELDEDLAYISDMMDLVGLATVGDVMPLLDENRFFVNESLRLISRGTRKQFTILKDKKKVKKLTEEAFGFQFSPIINSEGRLEGTPTKAMEFFLTEDEDEMNRLADELIAINEKRKLITTEQQELGTSLLEAKGLESVIIVSHKDFHEGIVGLVAGRLKEAYNRPVIVFSEDGDYLKGSARSIEALHMKHALDSISDKIEKFGGHMLAAGLTIKKENLEAFESALLEVSDKTLTANDLIPKIEVDVELRPEEVTQDLIAELDKLRPFGQGFIKPLFEVNGFAVNKSKVLYMGAEKNHLKLEDKSGLQLVMFKHADKYRGMGEPNYVKVLGLSLIHI